MAQVLHSQKNVLSSTVSPNKLVQFASSSITPIPNDVRLPNILVLNIPIYTLAFASTSTNELFEQFIKAYLEAQNLALVQIKPQKQLFKAYFPNFYYRNLYINYYRFD